jgi:DNA-binding beta-propeller fold protein YncE
MRGERVARGTFPNRRIQVLLTAVLALALAWMLFVFYQYTATKKPISELPGVPPPVAVAAAQRPPDFSQAFYGSLGAALASPMGVAVSPAGDRIYVTTSDAERVTTIFDRSGTPVGTLVPPDTEPPGRVPLYVAVDAEGTVYVSDRLRGVIDRYSAAGAYLGPFSPKPGPPPAPLALAFDRAGNFYVTDVSDGEHSIFVYSPTGDLKRVLGREGTAPGEFSFPNGVVTDANGNIYVADSNNGRVQIFDPSGQLRGILGREGRGLLSLPRGVAVDGLGRLFVVDTTGQQIQVWDVVDQPKYLYTIGSEGDRDGQFSFPNGAAVDETGRLYVTDRVNGRVVIWKSAY